MRSSCFPSVGGCSRQAWLPSASYRRLRIISGLEGALTSCSAKRALLHGTCQSARSPSRALAASMSEAAVGPMGMSWKPAPLPGSRQSLSSHIMKSEKRLVLVDVSSMLYPAYYSNGTVQGIVSEVLSAAGDLLHFAPEFTHWAFVMDAGGKNFRHTLYEPYKANRPPKPEEIRLAADQVAEIFTNLQIPVLRVPGVEADDVIACHAVKALDEGFGVAIVSPDKDFHQLLQDNLMMWKVQKKSFTGEAEQEDTEYIRTVQTYAGYTAGHFEREFKLRPSQWWDAQALMGDAADNVPGVRKIGVKSAVALLQQFGSLEVMLQIISKAPLRYQKLLSSEESHALARLSKQLVTLQINHPLPEFQLPLTHFKLAMPAERYKSKLSYSFIDCLYG